MLFVDWKLCSKNSTKWVILSSKKKFKNIKIWKKQPMSDDTRSAPGDNMFLGTQRLASHNKHQVTTFLGAHRLAAPRDRRLVHKEFQHLFYRLCLKVRSFRQAPLLLIWHVCPISLCFCEGTPSWTFWSSNNMIWSVWRTVRACGNYPFFLIVSLSSSTFIS